MYVKIFSCKKLNFICIETRSLRSIYNVCAFCIEQELDVLLVHKGIPIVIQMFVEVPLKPKGMILCNTFINKNPLFHNSNFEIIYICTVKVLCLHFCHALHLGQDKKYSINFIFKLNTTIMVLHKL
jgi:hypothetical protein